MKKIYAILVCMVLFTTIFTVTATKKENQIKESFEPEIEWTKTYGGDLIDWGNCVRQTSDGGYIISGTNFRNAWSFWFCYYYLIKTDASGNELWHQIYGEYNKENIANCVQETSDGGYIIAGYKGFSNMYDAVCQKTDDEGNIVWERTFGEPGLFDKAFSVIQTTDGGYTVVGFSQSYGAKALDVLLIKLNSDGSDEWIKVIGGNNNDAGTSIKQTNDGGYIIIGSTDSHNTDGNVDIMLIKTDSNGNEEWSKTFGTENYEDSFSVQQTSDGGYILLGFTPLNDGCSDIWLIKTDSSGNKLWDKTFGGSDYETGYSVQETTDGGYFIVGDKSNFETLITDIYTIKTDRDGNEQWSKIIDIAGDEDRGFYGIQTSDGGYAITGYTGSYEQEISNVVLIKIEKDYVEPELETKVTGGKGIKLEIKNIGETEATNINYIIHIEGGILRKINIHETGTINTLAAGDSKTISIKPFIGFGAIEITIDINEKIDIINGKQFFIFSLLNK